MHISQHIVLLLLWLNIWTALNIADDELDITIQDEAADPLLVPPVPVSTFVDNCQCDVTVVEPLCCDVGYLDAQLQDFPNACIAECNGAPAPALESGFCVFGTCQAFLDREASESEEEEDGEVEIVPLDVDMDCEQACQPELFAVPLCCEIDEDGTTSTFGNACMAQCEGITDVATQCVTGDCEVSEEEEDLSLCECDDINEEEDGAVCCDEQDFASGCLASCAGYDPDTQCVDGECEPPIEGLLSIGTPQEYSFMNEITIGIQLLIIVFCFLAMGCALPAIIGDSCRFRAFEFNKKRVVDTPEWANDL